VCISAGFVRLDGIQCLAVLAISVLAVKALLSVAVPGLWLDLSKCGASFIKRLALLHKGQSD
jgi:hypothetical protein